MENLAKLAKRNGTAPWDCCRLATQIMCDQQELALKKNVIYSLRGPTGKIYIGSTRRLLIARVAEHIAYAIYPDRNRGHKSKLYLAMRKHGALAFSVDVIGESTDETGLIDLEGAKIVEFNSVSSGYNIRVPHGVPGINSKFSESDCQLAGFCFNEGWSLARISEEFSCHPCTVTLMLDRIGINTKSRPNIRRIDLDDDQLHRLLSLHDAGLDHAAIGRMMGINRYRVRRALDRQLGKTGSSRDAANAAMRVVIDEARLISLFKSGLRLKDIGVELGISAQTANRYLRKCGIPSDEIKARKGKRSGKL